MNNRIELVTNGNIELCRDLCNELMSFQKSMAVIAPEQFDNMNFETRLKTSYENSAANHLVVVKDNDIPVGYVFSTVENVENGDKSIIPDWAPVQGKDVKGFYPDWDDLPEKVGCLNHLYLREAYRNMGLGTVLFRKAMEWLESIPEVDVTFVYISNGNDSALDFYLKHGFVFSHDVFGGFIKAAYKFKTEKL